jgi:hypothetical protein
MMKLTIALASLSAASLIIATGSQVVAQVPYGRAPSSSEQAAVPPPGAEKNTLFTDVEYVSGHEGFGEKKKGQLVVNLDGVGFFDNKGKPIFSLPAKTIRSAEHTRDIRGASVGKKLLFGALAGDRKQDFLTVTTESESTAEGVVFKVKQNAATGIAAKIGFYSRKARGEGPADHAEAPAVATATELAVPPSTPAIVSVASPSVASGPTVALAAAGVSGTSRSRADLNADVSFRLAMSDAQRVGIITDCEEVGTATLAVDLTDAGMAEGAAARHLDRIYAAYKRLSSWEPATILVLRHNGLSVGEYNSGGIAKGDWK